MEFTDDILHAFPGIGIAEGNIRSVQVAPGHPGLEARKQEVIRDVKSRYSLDQVRTEPVFRAYRDFFWSVGVDPTKTRPASEALVRRILSGGIFPRINTAVDAYNLASVLSGISIAAFDADTLKGDLTMRFAREGEQFVGIGMGKPVMLRRNQVILTDPEQIIAIYPYRDSDATKVHMGTRHIRILTCGVPRIGMNILKEAYEVCTAILEEYTGGTASEAVLCSG